MLHNDEDGCLSSERASESASSSSLGIDNILEHGRTKAYHHAANYFNKLPALDNQLEDYSGLMNKPQYIAAVQNKHWRKRSFWQQANYANR